MLASTISAAVLGVDAYEVRAEVDISGGLPNVTVAGLPDAAVQESRERVRAAIRNAGLSFPSSRVIVNLAPADVRKEGPAFDLPITLALLAAQDVVPTAALEDTVICGELALDGSVRPVRGAINIRLFAAQAGYQRVIVPPANAGEVAVVDGVEVFTPANLIDAIAFLSGRRALPPARPAPPTVTQTAPDLLDIKGQAAAKRALEIAATGRHNLLMAGPPGAGKTMLARRLPGLLPPLNRAEAVEATRIHSSAGTLTGPGLIGLPPFRAPHHTVSDAGLVGGGTVPRAGEVSLAHHGVLFMDEFPEFSRRALERLPQPLEGGQVTISRARASLTFPANFLLVAALNPCPCGHFGDPGRSCRCSHHQRRQYLSRLSGPLLDRLDLRIAVPRLTPDELLHARPSENSERARLRVGAAHALALDRQGVANGQLIGRDLRQHVRLEADAETFAHEATKRLALSGRGFDRLLRVARTIADLAAQPTVRSTHLAEVIGYREALGLHESQV